MEYHDAGRQLEYIRQSLSQSKKHLGVFLGAGCPLAVRVPNPDGDTPPDLPLIPDVAGLTAAIAIDLSTRPEHDAFQQIRAIFQEDEIAAYNIEDILSFIRSMSQVAGKGTVRGLSFSQLDRLDRAICEIISEIVNKRLPHGSTPYSDLAIWCRSLTRDKPVHIFTTNYDLLIEEALERESAPYFDGFIGSRNAFFDLAAVEDEKILPPRWLRLWKMHGSINWKLRSDTETKTMSIVRTDGIEDGQKHLIYPSHLKYDQSRKMPYLAMLDRVKDFLAYPSSILIMSGYSFSDDHINDTLLSGLKSNPTAMVYSFLYGSLSEDKYAKARACAMQTPNLAVSAFDEAIIGRRLAPWKCSKSLTDEENCAEVIKPNSEPPKTDDEDDQIECSFELGDFSNLGRLFRSLTHRSEDI